MMMRECAARVTAVRKVYRREMAMLAAGQTFIGLVQMKVVPAQGF